MKQTNIEAILQSDFYYSVKVGKAGADFVASLQKYFYGDQVLVAQAFGASMEIALINLERLAGNAIAEGKVRL